MQQTVKDILIQVLTIIGYEDDKDLFADEFIKLCQDQALIQLINSLPEKKQLLLKQELTQTEKTDETLQKYFTTKKFNDAVEKSIQEQFQSYLQEIYDTLSNEQKNNLDKLFTFTDS